MRDDNRSLLVFAVTLLMFGFFLVVMVELIGGDSACAAELWEPTMEVSVEKADIGNTSVMRVTMDDGAVCLAMYRNTMHKAYMAMDCNFEAWPKPKGRRPKRR